MRPPGGKHFHGRKESNPDRKPAGQAMLFCRPLAMVAACLTGHLLVSGVPEYQENGTHLTSLL